MPNMSEESISAAELLRLLEGERESSHGSNAGISLERIAVDGSTLQIRLWGFYTEDNSRRFFKESEMSSGEQFRATLRLLQTIGNCRSLRDIDVVDLSGKVLNTLLTPLQLNPALNSISIVCRGYASVYIDVESTCEILGRILQTSGTFKTLKLQLDGVGLTTAGVQHLASGLQLRDNDQSALEQLFLGGERVERSVRTQVAKIVHFAPRLSELTLRGAWVLDDSTLADELARSTYLKSLRLQDETGIGSSGSITSLHVHGGITEIGKEDFLPRLLSSNHSLKDFRRKTSSYGLTGRQGERLGRSLASSSSLEQIVIQIPGVVSPRYYWETIDGVEALLTAVDVKKPFVEVYLTGVHRSDPSSWSWNSESKFEWNDEEAEELLQEKNKPTLKLHWDLPGAELMEYFIVALRSSSTLRILSIFGADNYGPAEWKKLVVYLHHNTSITHLGLIDCGGLDEDVFKQFMGVLQVNLTLKKIRLTGTSWETDGKKALIEEALRRNAERDSYFSIFSRLALPFDPAKNARLFLCGSPFAGKTRLRHTLIRSCKGTSWLEHKAAELWSLRTKGIEVEFLKNDQEMQLAIWDLAGQWIFRTLQDILFPRTYQASIFLFMFSPYDTKKRCIKTDLDHCLKSELEEWLRFIASNSQIAEAMLPKVIVVMSHVDKMEDRDVTWADNIIMELRNEYKSLLEICNDKLYNLNACKTKEVVLLRDFIFDTFRKLLSHKTPHVPRVCSQISSILAKRTKDIKYRPVWSSQDFYSFCFDNLRGLRDFNQSLTPETSSGLQVFEAMASYLHDIGSVVIIRSLKQIIVDPNWLTNVFLGELITTGHNFDVKSKGVRKQKLSPISSKTGFVGSSDLQLLLRTFFTNHPEYRKLDTHLLENLLIHFDLCFKIERGPVNSRYYMPTLVCEDASPMRLEMGQRPCTGMEPLLWSSSPESGQEFIGFRVQCNDPKRMSMTDALFPRFQVHMRQKLMTEMNLTEDDVLCSRNLMHLHHMDGHEVFVERSDMAKSHIDVMVKCSMHKSREMAVKDVEKHIIEELRSFCASPKGCPGIALVVGLLQTKCVEKLVPLEHRGEKQAILVQKLKEDFEKYMTQRLEETKPESWSENNYSSLLNYELSWPPIPDYNLLGNSELARKLLPDSEAHLESVTKKILEKHEQQLKRVDQISVEIDSEIGHDQLALKMASGVRTMSRTPEIRDACSSSDTSQTTMGRVLSTVGHLRREMHERFDRVEVKLTRIEGNMNRIVTLNQTVQSSLSSFMSKLDRMIGYAESEERSRTPKRPYLSSDNISLYKKVIARMRLGTPVRLHLMCESMSGPHIVADQAGLDLCIEKENMEWLRCVYHISSRILYYLGKAALQVTLGAGNAVPELASLETTLPLAVAGVAMANIPTDDGMVSLERSGDMTLNEAWIRLRSSLAPYLRDNYTELFKLYRVKYRNLEEGGYAWVCEQCMNRGIRNGSLECL